LDDEGVVVVVMIFAPAAARRRSVEKRDRIVMSEEYDNPPDHERSISENGCCAGSAERDLRV
jgi:hypothetical protein